MALICPAGTNEVISFPRGDRSVFGAGTLFYLWGDFILFTRGFIEYSLSWTSFAKSIVRTIVNKRHFLVKVFSLESNRSFFGS